MSKGKLPEQTSTPHHLTTLPSKDALVAAFVGKPVSALRTPAIVINRTKFKANCELMGATVTKLGITFRAHVKTHKTVEGLRLQLEAGSDSVRAVVCSTMMECWAIAESSIVEERLLDDILYGLPVGVDKLNDLYRLSVKLSSAAITLRLMIDHPGQVFALEDFAKATGRTLPWSVFIKVDGGGRRAGLPADSEPMKELVSVALASPAVTIFGFYSHFGQSYASRSEADAVEFLAGEVSCVNSTAKLALALGPPPAQPYVLSVGASPTAHAAGGMCPSKLNGVLELHAGNYCCLDLQQVATKLIPMSSVASSVLTRVISLYPHRHEAMCDAGGIAMSKDVGPFPGFGQVVAPVDALGWDLGRTSQEHGTLVRREDGAGAGARHLQLGEQLRIVGQHSCMTLAAFPWYYIVEEGEDTVVDVWVAWKGW